jgi:hypothetical protein
MSRKILALFLLMVFLFANVSTIFARDFGRRVNNGEIIFTDGLYGAAIGGLVGVALVAIDDNDVGSKIGGGVLIGTLLGVAYGLHETKSFVEYKDGKYAFNIPEPVVEKVENHIVLNVPLFKAEFK